MNRRTIREKALQALFQIDISKTNPEDAIQHVLDGEKKNDYLDHLVFGVVENLETIDDIIKERLEKWTIDRLATVDRNLLRLATFEMLYSKENVPANVVINEAIEIAKVYGDEHSSRFVNGILAKVKSLKKENNEQ